MNVPTGSATHEIVERGSRFIALAEPVETRADAESAIRARRQQHPDATHVVYAFAVGLERSVQHGMSDDGEPKGTAGRPVLEILRGSGITNCLVSIVRYFGGTKLGTGGLVRAYGTVARMCIARLPVEAYVSRETMRMSVAYRHTGAVERAMHNHDARVLSSDYAETVTITIEIPSREVDQFVADVVDRTAGETTPIRVSV